MTPGKHKHKHTHGKKQTNSHTQRMRTLCLEVFLKVCGFGWFIVIVIVCIRM